MVTSYRAKTVYVAAVLTGVAVAILALSWRLAGPVATILYAVLFLVGAAGIPTIVGLGSKSFTGGMRRVFGNLHVILGQLALGHGYLVQRNGEWHICSGDEDTVYIDGDAHDIKSGKQNRTILGLRPFGVLRYKDDEVLTDQRADPAGEAMATRADGAGEVERAGFAQVTKPERPSGLGDAWLIDLKRVFSRGVRQIADIAAIEKAEEIAMREEAQGSSIQGWEAVVGGVVGLMLGLLTGYVMLVPS